MNFDLLMACILLFVGAFICLVAELVVPAHGFMAILSAAFAISGMILSFIVGPSLIHAMRWLSIRPVPDGRKVVTAYPVRPIRVVNSIC